jgi:hypothetical protein
MLHFAQHVKNGKAGDIGASNLISTLYALLIIGSVVLRGISVTSPGLFLSFGETHTTGRRFIISGDLNSLGKSQITICPTAGKIFKAIFQA